MRYDPYFRQGRECGLLLHQVMGWPGPQTSRQFMAWLTWYEKVYDEPSLTDHYLMQLAAEVMKSRVSKPGRVKTEWFRISFKEQEPEELKEVKRKNQSLLDKPDDGSDGVMDKPISTNLKENTLAISKSRWLGRMTAPVSVVEVKRGKES